MGTSEDTVATARELYDRESTFRAGIAAWVEDRRCDLRLVDLLLEYALTSQADCARWAATQPNRPSKQGWPVGKRKRKVCGPFPCFYAGEYYWFDCSGPGLPRDAHDVPRKYFGRQVNYQTNKFRSAADAILFLLDNWKPEQPAGEKPQRAPRRRAKD